MRGGRAARRGHRIALAVAIPTVSVITVAFSVSGGGPPAPASAPLRLAGAAVPMAPMIPPTPGGTPPAAPSPSPGDPDTLTGVP